MEMYFYFSFQQLSIYMYLMIYLQVQYLIIVTVLVSIYTLVLMSIDRSANISKGWFTVIMAIDRRNISQDRFGKKSYSMIVLLDQIRYPEQDFIQKFTLKRSELWKRDRLFLDEVVIESDLSKWTEKVEKICKTLF